MKLDKRGQQGTIPKILISMLLVGLFMYGMTAFLTDMGTQYTEVEVSSDLQSDLDVYDDSLRTIQNETVDFQNKSSETQATQDTDSGVKLENSFGALKNLISGSIGIATTMVETAALRIGIDGVYMWALIGVLIITVAGAFASAILRNPI